MYVLNVCIIRMRDMSCKLCQGVCVDVGYVCMWL